MGLRRQAREVAVQIIYMCDSLNSWNDSTVDLYYCHFPVASSVQIYSRLLSQGVIAHHGEIDGKIAAASEHWSINRMCRVDRAILRVATFEIMFGLTTPRNSAINEAVEIARRYSSDDSPQFVNGILDQMSFSQEEADEMRVGAENKQVA